MAYRQTITNSDGEILGTEYIYDDDLDPYYCDAYYDDAEYYREPEPIDPETCEHAGSNGVTLEGTAGAMRCMDCDKITSVATKCQPCNGTGRRPVRATQTDAGWDRLFNHAKIKSGRKRALRPGDWHDVICRDCGGDGTFYVSIN